MPASGSPLPSIPPGIRTYPNQWPGPERPAVEPGDVKAFTPMGFAAGPPMILRPWDRLEDLENQASYYAAQAHSFHPLHGAPTEEASGGCIYFDSDRDTDRMKSVFQAMGAALWSGDRNYAVFIAESETPRRDGFITHCKVLPFWALGHFYQVNPVHLSEPPQPQPMSVWGFLRGFIDCQQQRWGIGMSQSLHGCMGGDGDWAKEALCFGFMMENQTHQVLRIWSRAQLVTK